MRTTKDVTSLQTVNSATYKFKAGDHFYNEGCQIRNRACAIFIFESGGWGPEKQGSRDKHAPDRLWKGHIGWAGLMDVELHIWAIKIKSDPRSQDQSSGDYWLKSILRNKVNRAAKISIHTTWRVRYDAPNIKGMGSNLGSTITSFRHM